MISYLLFLTSIVLSQTEEIKRLPLRLVQTDPNSHPHRILDTYKTVAFETNYITNSESFAVEVDFGIDYKVANNILTSTHMFVYISTSETTLYGNCANYANYICSAPWCSVLESAASFDLPLGQSGTTDRVSTSIAMINGHWLLSSSALFFPSSCDSSYPAQSTISTAAYGWIGMGIADNAIHNYQQPLPIFSILINTTTRTGEIIFGKDSAKYDACTNPTILISDLNWQMVATSVSFGALQSAGFRYKLFFDLQETEIVLPITFQQFMIFFTTNYQMTCATSDFNGCTLPNIAGLPDLVFTMDNNVQITIPPGNYMKFVESTGLYTLGIRVVDNGDYFVLGWGVMSQYYIVFEQTQDGPLVYLYNHFDWEALENNCGMNKSVAIPFGYIIGFALFTIVFLGSILIVIKRAQKGKLQRKMYQTEIGLSHLELKGVNTTINPSNISLGKI